MEENYMKKYHSIIFNISEMENQHNDVPWYMDDYYCPALDELKNLFPNLSFSKEDLLKLRDYAAIKKNNDHIIYDLMDSKYGYSFYESHGHSKTAEEKEKENKAKQNKPEIDENYTRAFTTFFHICELLNGSDKEQDISIDIEQDVFEKLYEYGFELRPKNQMIKNYYEIYKKYMEETEKNNKLAQLNQNNKEQIEVVSQENTLLKQENINLKENVSVLRKMLSKTIDFCNHVKNSRFGKFFFKKQIKSLPEPNNIDVTTEDREI